MVKSRNLPGKGLCWEGKTAPIPKPRTVGSTPPHPLRQQPPWALWSPCGSAIMVRPQRLRGLSVGSLCRWPRKHNPETPGKGLWPIPKGIHPYSVSRGGRVSGALWCRAAHTEHNNLKLIAPPIRCTD